jgi:hypothetical protein
MNGTIGLARHGKQPTRLTPNQVRNFQPTVPPRIADLLNLARANFVFIPRVTADGMPCDPLLDQFLTLRKQLANEIEAKEAEQPYSDLLIWAEYSVTTGESETLLEGWVRMWVKTESERLAAEMLQAAHAQQDTFRLLDRVDTAIAVGQAAELLNDDTPAPVAAG